MVDQPAATFHFAALQPLPRRWMWWPACALMRHRIVGGYCRCRGVISFKIMRELDG